MHLHEIIETIDFSSVFELYWQIAPAYYRGQYKDKYEAPFDPFKVEYVDPSEIVHFTGRLFPRENKPELFGTVQSGEWDQAPMIHAYAEPEPTKTYLRGDEFCDSILYQSFEEHYKYGVEWEDTQLYSELVRLAQTGHAIWKYCTSEKEILDRCEYFDSVYESLVEDGYVTQKEIIRQESDSRRSFITALINEVLVDVGRNGEFLFVSGRHRLSMAKILELDSIPVGFLVRHPDWMEYRDHIYQNLDEQSPDHPDLCEFTRSSYTHTYAQQ